MSTPNIGSGRSPELTQQRIEQAAARRREYDGVEVPGWTESKTNDFKLVHHDQEGGQSTSGVDTKYTFYTRTDTTGGDSGTIQVWSRDDKGNTQHMGSYYKDEGYQKFHKNNNIANRPLSNDPRVKALQNKSNTLLVQENARQNLKTAALDSCIEKKGAGAREECNKQAEGYANNILLNEEANEALQEAEKNQEKSDAEAQQEAEEALTSDVDNAQMRKEYADITYPVDLNTEYQDFIQFQMIEYVPRKFSSKSKGGGIPSRNKAGLQTVLGQKDANGKRNLLKGAGNAIKTGGGDGDYSKGQNGERKVLATMTLPIPAGIQDQNGVDWGQAQLNMLDQQLAGLAMNVTAGNAGAATDDIFGKLKNPATGEAVRVATVEQMLSGADVVKREYGAVLNKNMELLFNGPRLRGFSFTFRMSPRNPEEAKAVRGIIRQFKQGMSPKKGKTFTFIKAPHTWFIGYYHKGSTSPWLNMFKECALESMSMDYTPDGQYSTFTDGALTSYQMQLSFKELEPVFDSDYDEGTGGADNNFIGY